MCRAAGIHPPEFSEVGPSAVVTFKVQVATNAQVTAQVIKVLETARTPQSREDLQKIAGISHREHFRSNYLLPWIDAGWMELTIPDKPNSRLQKYQTTALGLAMLQKKR